MEINNSRAIISASSMSVLEPVNDMAQVMTEFSQSRKDSVVERTSRMFRRLTEQGMTPQEIATSYFQGWLKASEKVSPEHFSTFVSMAGDLFYQACTSTSMDPVPMLAAWSQEWHHIVEAHERLQYKVREMEASQKLLTKIVNERNKAVEESEKRLRQLTFTYELANLMASSSEPGPIFERLVNKLKEFMKMDGIWLQAVNSSQHEVRLEFSWPTPPGGQQEYMRIERSECWSILQERKVFVANEPMEMKKFPIDEVIPHMKFQSGMMVPLFSGHEPLGVMTIASYQPGVFDEEAVQTIWFAAPVLASAIASRRRREGVHILPEHRNDVDYKRSVDFDRRRQGDSEFNGMKNAADLLSRLAFRTTLMQAMVAASFGMGLTALSLAVIILIAQSQSV